MRIILLLAITFAVLAANAREYTVSFITLNRQPAVEIIVDGAICIYGTTNKDLIENPTKIVKEALAKCR